MMSTKEEEEGEPRTTSARMHMRHKVRIISSKESKTKDSSTRVKGSASYITFSFGNNKFGPFLLEFSPVWGGNIDPFRKAVPKQYSRGLTPPHTSLKTQQNKPGRTQSTTLAGFDNIKRTGAHDAPLLQPAPLRLRKSTSCALKQKVKGASNTRSNTGLQHAGFA